MPRLRFVLRLLSLVLLTCLAAPSPVTASTVTAADAATDVSVESVLKALQATGVDVIYSSALVSPELKVPAPTGVTPLQRARAALAACQLELQQLGAKTFVVARATARTPAATVAETVDEPLPEISVYASRYAIEGGGESGARTLTTSDIEVVPGSHDDALRALKALPGLATNASGRPYIRGSLNEDILVRYDGINLLDPFHLKNFQSLISAIDPAAIARIEVFSGGFPVRYGTRSGGVIDVSAPTAESGIENRASLSLISAGLSSIGRAERWPLEWVAAIRRSTLDLLDPVEEAFGKPQFGDSLGRVKWHTDQGAWTAGWLLIDDRLKLGLADDEEQATARYRDEYLWLARDHRFSDALSMRATAVVSAAVWNRASTLLIPGVAEGAVRDDTTFDRYEFTNTWTFAPHERSTYSFGAEAALSRARRDYQRTANYSPEIAAAFDKPVAATLDYRVRPEAHTYALFAAKRHRWADFEAEVGLRLDAQDYELGGYHTQISPRLNLRYDRSPRLRYYASLGRFTQAQHVEEWRSEDSQSAAHAAQVSIHSILGVSLESSPDTRWSLEAYSKRWTSVAPYFDNLVDPLALAPDLSPDRIRISPRESEAAGFELNLRHALTQRLSATGTLAWSRVADVFQQGDVRRSWDQPLALTVGLAWEAPRYSLSMLSGWHKGWPRTQFDLAPLTLQARNADRWRDFLSLDLRGSWRWTFSRGELLATLEVTNASNRNNECCTVFQREEGGSLALDTEHWLPIFVNLGFNYRWKH
jgi:outer membrane receptor protein involved in Fe transport